ncbi:hypothetical protein CY35_09G090900 [Sphagnum magellanicum]|nr:hypothetical protein CY35_09G090900 [Sphagnum magellanicum]
MLNTTAAAAAESSGTYCCTRVGSAFAVSTGLGSSWGGGSEPLLWWLRLVLTRVLKKPRPELEEWELEAASNSSSKGVASICDEGFLKQMWYVQVVAHFVDIITKPLLTGAFETFKRYSCSKGYPRDMSLCMNPLRLSFAGPL